MKPHFIDPDAALIDEVGSAAPWLRVQPERAPRDLMSDPAYLRARRIRLADRLRMEGGDPGELVEIDDAALYEEVLRLEREIGEAMTIRRAAPIQGLDEPFGGEPLAAE
jgi:hypothetical protein